MVWEAAYRNSASITVQAFECISGKTGKGSCCFFVEVIRAPRPKTFKQPNDIGTTTGEAHEKEQSVSAGSDSEPSGFGEAEQYLNAALEEDDPELFLLALRNVAEAQGGIAQLADKAKLNRESLYRMLSDRGNPELRSLDALLHALGFRLAVTANR